MPLYLLDTSVYGVLAEKGDRDYSIVRKIIGYAKENRERFISTFIIAREIDSEHVDKLIKDIILPEYYSSISGILEIFNADKSHVADRLAWNYIQKLGKRDVVKSMPDALNYAWASVGDVDVFVTRNRRGILAESHRKILQKSNSKFGLKFVKVTTPKQFAAYLF